MKPIISQRNDRIYLTGNLSVINPTTEEIASFQNLETVKRTAPNEKILWLSGEYVDTKPNRNGQVWSADEIAIKSLTPVLMPVTIMHDFRSAVGVIADTRLDLAVDETADEGQSAKLSTILAIWAHRFPEIAAEIVDNHNAGTLMQSMECDAPSFSCEECSELFVKPVNDDSLCAHIRKGTAGRTLHNVTFTGSGLIFGSRGKVGANPSAHLDVLAEVAEWSDTRNGSNKKRPRTVEEITIKKSEYDELRAKAARAEETEAARQAAEAEKARADEAETKLTEAEVKEAAQANEIAELKQKVESFESEKAEAELASKRLAEMPKEIAAKLPDSTRDRVARKARTMNDEEWSDEVASLAEILNVNADSGNAAGETFAETALHSFNPAGAANNGGTSSFGGSRDPEKSVADVSRGVATMLRDVRKAKTNRKEG